MQPNLEISSIEELEIDRFATSIGLTLAAEITLLDESVVVLSLSSSAPPFYQKVFQILSGVKNNLLYRLLYFKPPDKIMEHHIS